MLLYDPIVIIILLLAKVLFHAQSLQKLFIHTKDIGRYVKKYSAASYNLNNCKCKHWYLIFIPKNVIHTVQWSHSLTYKTSNTLSNVENTHTHTLETAELKPRQQNISEIGVSTLVLFTCRLESRGKERWLEAYGLLFLLLLLFLFGLLPCPLSLTLPHNTPTYNTDLNILHAVLVNNQQSYNILVLSSLTKPQSMMQKFKGKMNRVGIKGRLEEVSLGTNSTPVIVQYEDWVRGTDKMLTGGMLTSLSKGRVTRWFKCYQ